MEYQSFFDRAVRIITASAFLLGLVSLFVLLGCWFWYIWGSSLLIPSVAATAVGSFVTCAVIVALGAIILEWID